MGPLACLPSFRTKLQASANLYRACNGLRCRGETWRPCRRSCLQHTMNPIPMNVPDQTKTHLFVSSMSTHHSWQPSQKTNRKWAIRIILLTHTFFPINMIQKSSSPSSLDLCCKAQVQNGEHFTNMMNEPTRLSSATYKKKKKNSHLDLYECFPAMQR